MSRTIPITPVPAGPSADGLGCHAGADALQAAAREDVDEVRAIATRLDALPKPDLGNKAIIARRL